MTTLSTCLKLMPKVKQRILRKNSASDVHSLTIWLQPPFFSIRDLHFGHPLVYFVIYRTVSSLLSFSHFSIKPHEIGSWWSALQLKQKLKPQVHVHFCWYANSWLAFTAKSHFGLGHHCSWWLNITKLFVIRCWYFWRTLLSEIICMIVSSSTMMPHFSPGQLIVSASPSSVILRVKYWRQQSSQYSWPQPRSRVSYFLCVIRKEHLSNRFD